MRAGGHMCVCVGVRKGVCMGACVCVSLKMWGSQERMRENLVA